MFCKIHILIVKCLKYRTSACVNLEICVKEARKLTKSSYKVFTVKRWRNPSYGKRRSNFILFVDFLATVEPFPRFPNFRNFFSGQPILNYFSGTLNITLWWCVTSPLGVFISKQKQDEAHFWLDLAPYSVSWIRNLDFWIFVFFKSSNRTQKPG